MRIGLHSLGFHRIPKPELDLFGQKLVKAGFEIWVSHSLFKPFEKTQGLEFPFSGFFGPGDDIPQLEILLSLGGDGTILDTLLYSVPAKIPVLGINFGRMGFLAKANSAETESIISFLKKGKLDIFSRPLLSLESEEGPLFPENFALNEITITKRDTASMITIETKIEGEFLNEYWGDGLIISTATGSTGYSLSCGGPILLPDNQSIVITPISPHNLSMRPLVLPDHIALELKPKSRHQKIMVSMDSRSRTFPSNQILKIKKGKLEAMFIQYPGYSFGNAIREKLFWGKDLRN
jgi:NAD+ kinase